MVVMFALLAVLSVSIGTVLTRNVMNELPGFEPIGPLFILNGLIALAVSFGTTNFKLPNAKESLLLVLAAVFTTIGAFMVFFIIEKSTPATSLVGQALSPIFVLFLNLIFFGIRFSPLIGLVAFAMSAGCISLISNTLGIRARNTFFLIFCQGAVAALVAILLSKLTGYSLSIYEVIALQQLLSGVLGVIVRFPKHLRKSLLPIFTLRSLFMSLGWIFTAFSLRTHHVFQSQVLISLTPLVTVAIQTRQNRLKGSNERLWYAGILVVASVSYLEIAAHR